MSHKKLSWVCYPTAILLGLLFGCFLTPTGEPFRFNEVEVAYQTRR